MQNILTEMQIIIDKFKSIQIFEMTVLIFFSQPALVDVGVSAFLAIPVIVRCAAGRAFAICITIVMVISLVGGICSSFRCGCAITG
jgi:hypothetical protein